MRKKGSLSFIAKVGTAHECSLYFFLETIFDLSKTSTSSEILPYPIYKMQICSQNVALENLLANIKICTTFWSLVARNLLIYKKICYESRVIKATCNAFKINMRLAFFSILL